MCKKSKFPLIFNIFLAFFITLVVTIFVKAGEGALTGRDEDGAWRDYV